MSTLTMNTIFDKSVEVIEFQFLNLARKLIFSTKQKNLNSLEFCFHAEQMQKIM